MRATEYAARDGLELADLVRRREVAPSELLEAAIAAAETVNPSLNGMVHRFYDRARALARDPGLAGPLRGVPFLFKDNLDWEGTVTSYGSRLLATHSSTYTHPIVERYLGAGLVPFGRTNMSEIGLIPYTEPVAFGPTHNPWSPAHSPGGSSGGAAAMVAAGVVPVAHAADGGGSIRIPASACGLVGLKPSRGRHPTATTDDPDGFVSQHVVSRTVRDSAAWLDCIAGARPEDRWQLAPPAGSFVEAAGRDPARLRIALAEHDYRRQPLHPDCRAAVTHTARALEALGHVVEPATPDLDGWAFIEAFKVVWSQCAGYFFNAVRHGADLSRLPPRVREVARTRTGFMALLWASQGPRAGAPLEPMTRRLIRIDGQHRPSDLWHAWTVLVGQAHTIGRFLSTWDLLLTPVLSRPPWRTGEFKATGTDSEVADRLFSYAGFAPICNTSGLPAIALPSVKNGDGIPIGVQLVAGIGKEELLLSVAGQLERAGAWALGRPRVSVARD